MMLLSALRERAALDPDRIAIDPITQAPLTYAELAREVGRMAERLARDHAAKRPVALGLDHGVDEALLELALLSAGIPVLALPAFFTDDQARHAMNDCGADTLFDTHSPRVGAPYRAEAVALPSGTARITFTSGSTGRPKGVCLSAPHLIEVAGAVVDALGPEHVGRHLAVLPPGILLETVAGFFATMLSGGTYVCPPQALIGLDDPFRPDCGRLARAVADWGITSLILVPEYLAGLVQALEAENLRLPQLTLVAVGGARTPPALIARARALGLPVRQGYGLTEFGSVVSLEDGSGAAAGSVGRPLRHVAARTAPDGEIILQGTCCLGVVGAPSASDLLATGDIGHIDAEGRLWIDGRKSSLIVTSFGRNIAPEWVEEALLAQPAIAQAMVYGEGLPRPNALLVPARPDADLDAAVAAANALLPAYAQVASWSEVAHFTPRTGQLTDNGRLRRQAITNAYLTGEPAFFTELEAATVRQRLRFLAVPQVRAGLAGDICRETYIAYLAQAWHHVRHTVPLLRAARDRLCARAELAEALDDYVAEEQGHDEWILADIAASGGDADAVRRSDPASATRAMVDHAYARIRQGNPVALFGMIYVLESVSIALAQRGAHAVAEKLGLPPAAFTYLTSHGALDQEHLAFFAQLVNRLDDPIDRDAIIEMARDMFGLFGAIFASIPLETLNEAA